MNTALVGLAGIVVGTSLGGVGKYWSLRRDAWSAARASGLLLLADVRALRAAQPTASVVSNTRMGVASWEAQRTTLARFRPGSYPNGLTAPQWLRLADGFARLERLDAALQTERNEGWWSDAQSAFGGAESLLACFEKDPPVFRHAIHAGWKRALRGQPADSAADDR